MSSHAASPPPNAGGRTTSRSSNTNFNNNDMPATSTAQQQQQRQHVTPDITNQQQQQQQQHAKQQQQQRQYYSSLTKRMTVNKNIVDELLLVCGVLGTTDEKTGEFVPVEDCLNWLQDLQRALRRDDDLYRPVSLLLGQWNVVQQKLLPLVLTCRYDTALVLTICKILVILTKPLAENTVKAGRMVIDTKKKGKQEAVIQEQIKLRDNALQQAEMLLAYKRAVCHHPSHQHQHQHQHHAKEGSGGGGDGVLSVFVSLLAEPLSKQGTHRTDADHLTIELVLHLFRNLLSAEPLLYTSADAMHRNQQLHHEFITLLEQELVLDIFLVLGADLEQRENAPYNLLLMELLHHLIKQQDPTAVARSALSLSSSSSSSSNHKQGLLKSQLQRERQSLAVKTTSRHSHFSGTLVVQKKHQQQQQKQQYVSTNRLLGNNNTNTTAARRKSKKTEPFIGAVGSLQMHRARGPGAVAANSSPAAIRAQQTLHRFCQRFVQDCYGPVMKSLKNEFRRDSVRLEDGDRVIFAKIVWFFGQWWRAGGRKTIVVANKNDGASGDRADADVDAAVDKDSKSNEATNDENKANEALQQSSSAHGVLGQLIFTLDLFTFKLVLNAIDTFQTHKRYTQLAQVVALLSEMMHQLFVMYQSKESTEQLMAMGLMDRLFYGSDPLDHLPKLLSRWAPGTSTREYLCDLVEICHMTLKLLDAHAVACNSSDTVGAKTGNKGNKTKKTKQQLDTIAKMKAAVADFDVTGYFIRKIVSNQTVLMYTHLLSQYSVNSPAVNHRIVAFFMRLCKVKVAVAEPVDDDMPKNLLAAKTVTLEPMLYNVRLMMALNTILNDPGIRKDKDYATILSFASNIVYNFAVAASENPMLFVEAMFKHPVPHRFCELSTNLYVNEELRMLAERDLLLEEQQRFEQRIAEDEKERKEESDDSDEEELEFEDHGLSPTSKRPGNKDEEDSVGDEDRGSIKNSSGSMRDLDEGDSDEDDSTDMVGGNGEGIDHQRTGKRSLDHDSEDSDNESHKSSDAKRHRSSDDVSIDGNSRADDFLAGDIQQNNHHKKSMEDADDSPGITDRTEETEMAKARHGALSRIRKREVDNFSDDEDVAFDGADEDQVESKSSTSKKQPGDVFANSDDED